MKKTYLFGILIAALLLLAGFGSDDAIRRGIELFTEGNFSEALEAFSSAREQEPDNGLATYNAHTSMLHAGEIADLEQELTEQRDSFTGDKERLAKTEYNLGTAYLAVADQADKQGQLMQKAGELQNSVKWLRQSLLDNAADVDAKNNLEYAQKLMEKLEQEQQQNQDQNKENQDQQQQQDQDQQQKQNQDQQEQNEQDQQQQQQQNQQQQQKKEQQEREISEATAKNLLDAAKEAEMRALKQMRDKQNKKRNPKGRDW